MELRTKLNSLWDRLQIDVTYREHFVSTKKGFGKSVIQEVHRVLIIFILTLLQLD